jgi:hypothetical protein
MYRETTLTHEKLKPEQFGHSIPEYDGLFWQEKMHCH